jgi:hypothetical protein
MPDLIGHRIMNSFAAIEPEYAIPAFAGKTGERLAIRLKRDKARVEPAHLGTTQKPPAPARHARPDRAPHYQQLCRTRLCDSRFHGNDVHGVEYSLKT